MANKILPIFKTKLVDYSNNQIFNFWQAKENNSHSSTLNFKDRIIELLQSVSEGVICIQSAAITDKQVIKQIFDTAQGREVKIYLLVNQYSPELNLVNEVCLIRYNLKNIGSFILTNPNSNQKSGLFFGGHLTEQSLTLSNQILNELKEKEVTELYHHFCFHFWETAKKEVIEVGKHNIIYSKPLDVYHDTSAFGERDFVYSTLFNFVESQSRIKLSGKLIVYLKKENQNPILIKPMDVLEIGKINLEELLSLQEFENHTPDLHDSGTTCKLEYQWTNVPFYLPESCNQSSLYEKWKNESEKINTHLNSILEKIKSAETKEKTISKALSRFFLGKKTSFNKLKSDIEVLKKVDFANISDKEVIEKITEINQILSQVEGEISDIDQEDRKARIDEEIVVLKEKELEKNKLLAEKKVDLHEKEIKKREKLIGFLEKHKIEETLLGKVKNEWQQQSGQKHKQKNPKEAQEAEAKLIELNEIQNQVFVDKIKSEIEILEREIKRCINEISVMEIEKSKSKQSNDSKSSLNEFVGKQTQKQGSTSNNNLLTVPNLPQLPKTGRLFQLNSQSYLAIENWEEYNQGKFESERLKAKLCAYNN